MIAFSRKTARRKAVLTEHGCPKSTEIFAVAGCQKFMTHLHNCQDAEMDWYSDMSNAIDKEAGFLGKTRLRELKLENGKTVTRDDPIPGTVYALFDKELFVFPTCQIGTQYVIDLPSSNMRVNITGAQIDDAQDRSSVCRIITIFLRRSC